MDYQNREKVVKRGVEISSRLQAIGNMEKRTKNKELFKNQRDELRKEMLKLRKER